MKTKLLKKIRRWAREDITIYSITTQGELVVGMSIGYGFMFKARNLFSLGDTEEDVLKKAEHAYFNQHRDDFKKRYSKPRKG